MDRNCVTNFESIKFLPQQKLREIRLVKLADICVSSLDQDQESSQNVEIFKFILNDYLDLLPVSGKQLEDELFAFILPELAKYFKQKLTDDQYLNNLTELSILMIVLSNLAHYMKSKVLPENPNILYFDNFCSYNLEIIEMCLSFCNECKEDQSDFEDFLTNTTKVHLLLLSIFETCDFFTEPVQDNDQRYYNLVSHLMSIIKFYSNLDMIAEMKSKVGVTKIMINNSKGIIQNIDTHQSIAKTLEMFVQNENDTISSNVEQFTNEERPNLKNIKMDMKLLIRITEEFKHNNFRGLENHLRTLIKLFEVQYDDTISDDIKLEVRQEVIVGFMITLKWIYANPDFMKTLIEISATENKLGIFELCLEILKIMLQNGDREVISQFAQNNSNNNIFHFMLNFLAKHEWILYNEIFYQQTVIYLNSLLIACANQKSLFQYMEVVLLQQLMSGRYMLGMLCADIWILFARVIPQQLLLKYFHFFNKIYCESCSLLSSNVSTMFLKIILKNFYRIMAPKLQRTIEVDKKIASILRSGSEANKNFVQLGIPSNENQRFTNVTEFYEMLTNLKYSVTSSMTSDPILIKLVKKLLESLGNVENINRYSSVVSVLIDVIVKTTDLSTVLQYLISLNKILGKNSYTLSVELNFKMIELVDHLISILPGKLSGGGLEKFLVQELQRIVKQDQLVLRMRLFQLFSRNSKSLFLSQLKKTDQLIAIVAEPDSLLKSKNKIMQSLERSYVGCLPSHFCAEVQDEIFNDEIFSTQSSDTKRKLSSQDSLSDFFQEDDFFQSQQPNKKQKSESTEEILQQLLEQSQILLLEKHKLTDGNKKTIEKILNILNKTNGL